MLKNRTKSKFVNLLSIGLKLKLSRQKQFAALIQRKSNLIFPLFYLFYLKLSRPCKNLIFFLVKTKLLKSIHIEQIVLECFSFFIVWQTCINFGFGTINCIIEFYDLL